MAWSFALLGAERGVHFGKTASIGNASDLEAADFLTYMGQDDRIDFICLYLEGLQDGRRFLDALRDACRRKPVALWKAGRTEAGSKAAASHTAALAGDTNVFRGVARQTGAIWCADLADMLDMIPGMGHAGVPQGLRVGVVSAPGGAGVVTADACEDYGLRFAQFTPETEARLRAFLPEFASPRNPVDLTGAIFGDMTLYPRALDVVMEDPGVDLVFVLGPSEIDPELFGRTMADGVSRGRWSKPLVVPWIASDKAFEAGAALLRQAGIACYSDPARAAWTVAQLSGYGQFRARRGLDPWGGVRVG